MSAARRQNDVLEMFYGEIPVQVNKRLRRPFNPRMLEIEDVFFTSQNSYNEWLRVWKMIVSERNHINKDLFLLQDTYTLHYLHNGMKQPLLTLHYITLQKPTQER